MHELLEKLYAGHDLTAAETQAIFAAIFTGSLDPIVFGSLLTALKMNGYTADEIGGAAAAMIAAAVPFPRDRGILTGEIVGTGGDRLHTFNISTLAALTCARLGLHIAKHGNTAVSSKTGASDLLSCLGYDIRCAPALTRRNLEQEGFAFFFAQIYHPGMRYAAPVRKALATSTIFNILGPLTNPAAPDYMLLGCYDPKLLTTLAGALRHTGVKRAWVVNGGGMDEITVCGATAYAALDEAGNVTAGTLNPEDFGIPQIYRQSELDGGTPEENARLAQEILSGRGTPAQTAAVAVNAAAALYLSGREPDLKAGCAAAQEALAGGAVAEKLRLVCANSRGDKTAC